FILCAFALQLSALIYLIRKYIAYQKYERKTTTEIKGTKLDFVLAIYFSVGGLSSIITSQFIGNMNGRVIAFMRVFALLQGVFCIFFIVV
ncbi:MAG: hypothetical protein LBJ90_07585, partial [Treponema sp.]|nr:hypothetical protein [Treponema sp.]